MLLKSSAPPPLFFWLLLLLETGEPAPLVTTKLVILHPVLGRLQRGVQPAHAAPADHHVRGLAHPLEHALLHVGHAVPGAQRAQARGPPLVRQHAQVRPHVVLDLVVEPAVGEVQRVVAPAEVDAARHLPHVERPALRPHRPLESVHVRAGMVGDTGGEGVRVRQQLRQQQVDDGVAEQPGPPAAGRQQQQRRGQQQEPRDQEGREHAGGHLAQGHQLAGGPIAGPPGEEQRVQGDGRRGVQARRQRPALAPVPLQLKLLVSVGGVVDPLPNRRQQGYDCVFQGHWQLGGPQRLHVPLHQIWILLLPKAVVVQPVVLDVPGLGQYPVPPVAQPPHHRAHREAPAVKAACIDTVVTPMASVVCNHGPAHVGPSGQGGNSDWVWKGPHCRHANERRYVLPEKEFFQVLYVFLPCPLQQFFSQCVDVTGESVIIKLRSPVVCLLSNICWKGNRFCICELRHLAGCLRCEPKI
mmetsp:Transcript_18521/g.29262  ORF Transcript_18521/g.29262 Transcript_18521/m.29262 type:complete len:469 (-) Transcript_18521:160-1566(-)